MTKVYLASKKPSAAAVWLEGELEQNAYALKRLRLKINAIEGALCILE